MIVVFQIALVVVLAVFYAAYLANGWALKRRGITSNLLAKVTNHGRHASSNSSWRRSLILAP